MAIWWTSALDKSVPIQSDEFRQIPVIIAKVAYEEYRDEFGDSQSFERLHQRGGFGQIFMRGEGKFLSSVFKMGGKFYYVWDIFDDTFSAGSFASSQGGNQINERFLMGRDIAWTSNPIQTMLPRDGTGDAPAWKE